MNAGIKLAELAIGEIALLRLTHAIATRDLNGVDRVKAECEGSVYWADFRVGVSTGLITENFVPGALGRVVVGWAKGAA